MEEKDYFEIVLNGFVSNRKYLTDYFIREYKEAEIKNYGFAEFFNKCLNVVSAIDKELKKQYYSDKKEIQEGLQAAISTNDKDAEDIFREQLAELKENDITATYYQFSHGRYVFLNNDDVVHIALSIGLALKTIQEQTPATSSKTEPSATIENPHQRIFPNGKCWQLFEYWKVNAIDIKADICFAYWQMIEDKLMYNITPTQFTEWLFKDLNFDFEGYWKQLTRVNKPERKRLYSMTKLQFQLNKSQY